MDIKSLPIILLVLTSLATAQDNAPVSTQLLNVPQSVIELFKSNKLDQQYDFSFKLNPFYLRGDFDGDSKPDIAILVSQKTTNKIGIAICHSASGRIFIVGAGRSLGNGGDDFGWMDVWQVFPKGRVSRGAGEKSVPTLKGEALSVQKSESASALIYWNGGRYVWYQQGD